MRREGKKRLTAKAREAAGELQAPGNPVEAKDVTTAEPKPVPMMYAIPQNRIEVSWLVQALMTVLAQVQEALSDDGKISAGEAWSIAMTLLNLVWELLSGKR